jgi:hypothetical protein
MARMLLGICCLVSVLKSVVEARESLEHSEESEFTHDARLPPRISFRALNSTSHILTMTWRGKGKSRYVRRIVIYL